MTRMIILTLLNMALPFLIRAGWLLFIRWMYKRRAQKEGLKDVTPPKWHFPVLKLLIIGFILLCVSLLATRFITHDDQRDGWTSGNQALSKEF